MQLQFVPETSHLNEQRAFQAKHPMFAYQVPPTPDPIKALLAKADQVVVLGIGGSTLPLRVFLDAACLNDRVHLVETVDPSRFEAVKNLKNAIYCVVSKSGETLEIKTWIAELIEAGLLSRMLVVTDPEKGSLRKWATEQKLPTLEIPPTIGGRFTHFSPFHRALLERFGVNFSSWLEKAQQTRSALQKNPAVLERLFQQVFRSSKENLVLWAYGEKLPGLASWAQQAIAESLGKRTASGKRVGIFPIVLKGPQDQHSVLQLLMDGPQRNAFWFLTPSPNTKPVSRKLPPPFEDFNRLSSEKVLDVLAQSTMRTFEERTQNTETLQPLAKFEIAGHDDLVEAVVTMQAFIEYAGERLEISAFDQPGVERGKQIAREILKTI